MKLLLVSFFFVLITKVNCATLRCILVPFETKEGKSGTCCIIWDKQNASTEDTTLESARSSEKTTLPDANLENENLENKNLENTTSKVLNATTFPEVESSSKIAPTIETRKIITGKPKCSGGEIYDSFTEECVQEFSR